MSKYNIEDFKEKSRLLRKAISTKKIFEVNTKNMKDELILLNEISSFNDLKLKTVIEEYIDLKVLILGLKMNKKSKKETMKILFDFEEAGSKMAKFIIAELFSEGYNSEIREKGYRRIHELADENYYKACLRACVFMTNGTFLPRADLFIEYFKIVLEEAEQDDFYIIKKAFIFFKSLLEETKQSMKEEAKTESDLEELDIIFREMILPLEEGFEELKRELK